MSFIHVHILQRPKAIHVNGYKSVEEPVKAKKMHSFFHIFAVCKHKRDFNKCMGQYMGLISLHSCTCTCIVKGLI